MIHRNNHLNSLTTDFLRVTEQGIQLATIHFRQSLIRPFLHNSSLVKNNDMVRDLDHFLRVRDNDNSKPLPHGHQLLHRLPYDLRTRWI